MRILGNQGSPPCKREGPLPPHANHPGSIRTRELEIASHIPVGTLTSLKPAHTQGCLWSVHDQQCLGMWAASPGLCSYLQCLPQGLARGPAPWMVVIRGGHSGSPQSGFQWDESSCGPPPRLDHINIQSQPAFPYPLGELP